MMGVDPEQVISSTERPLDSEHMIGTLYALCAKTGAHIAPLAVDRIADAASDLTNSAGWYASIVVLEGSDGHVYMVLGKVPQGGSEALAVVHGAGPVFLLGISRLQEFGISKAWMVSTAKQESIDLEVGQGKLRVNALVADCGLLIPDAERKVNFHLTNVGSESLHLGKVRSSCGCATPSVPGDGVIEVGQSVDINVSVRATEGASLRHALMTKIKEIGDEGSERILKFELMGVCAHYKQVIPTELDFGTITEGQTETRSVRISETEYDRFSVLQIQAQGLPVSTVLSSQPTSNGLSQYIVKCTCNARNLAVGEHTGQLLIRTDSAAGKEVRIPLSVVVASPIRCVPAELSFGMVDRSKSATSSFELTSDRAFLVDDVILPPNCTLIEMKKDSDRVRVVIQVNLKGRKGLWRDKVTMKCLINGRVQIVALPCSAYALR